MHKYVHNFARKMVQNLDLLHMIYNILQNVCKKSKVLSDNAQIGPHFTSQMVQNLDLWHKIFIRMYAKRWFTQKVQDYFRLSTKKLKTYASSGPNLDLFPMIYTFLRDVCKKVQDFIRLYTERLTILRVKKSKI